jgi:hypothetical protein
MVFKSVRGSHLATAATCLVGTREWIAKLDHPAHIPRRLVDRPGYDTIPFGFRWPAPARG